MLLATCRGKLPERVMELTGETLPEPTEPVVEGTIVAEFSPAVETAERPGFTRKLSSFLFGEQQEEGPSAVPPSGQTVGALLGFTETVLELPPGDILTVNQGRLKTFEVAAGSPLVAQIPRGFHLVKQHGHVALSPGEVTDPRAFQLVSVDGQLAGEGSGANLVARARKEPAEPGLLADTTRSHALLFSGLGAVYVGPGGFTTPVGAAELVVDAFGVDRTLLAAANAAKAKSHFCQGGSGTLQGSEVQGSDGDWPPCNGCSPAAERMCCMVPWTLHALFFSPLILFDILRKTLCNKHKDMEFPPWGDAALVLTEKGIVGRRHFGPDSSGEQLAPTTCKCCFCCGPVCEQEGTGGGGAYWNVLRQPSINVVNAIAWDGFDVDKIRIRTYDASSRCVTPGDPRMAWDPLVVGPYFACCVPMATCCRCICIQPEVDRLYRATIFSEHKFTYHDSDGGGMDIVTGSIELLALARSPDDLRNTLRAAKEKYGAPAAAAMER